LDGSGNNYAEGSSFTPSATSTFGSLQIALSFFFVPLSGFTVALNADSGSDTPGVAIESFSVSGGLLGALGNNNSPLVLNTTGFHVLTTGTKYWITVSTADSGDSIVWNWNSTGDVSDQAISTDGSVSWFSPSGLTPGAFEVESAVAVPEPSTFIIGAMLLLSFAISALRKSRKSQTA